MNKRILMISGDRSLARGDHGAFYYTLKELRKYFERIDIICPPVTGSSHENQVFENVFVHPSSFPLALQSLFIINKGRELIKKYAIQALTVHEYPPFYNGVGVAFLYLFTGRPYLLEIHHIPGHPRAGSFKELVYRIFTRFFIAFDAYFANRIRVVNHGDTPKFLQTAGVSRGKLIYCPSFYIDFKIFHPYEDVAKKYDFVFAARLENNKGILNLIQAIAIAKKTKPDISLLIIGRGSLLNTLRSYVSSAKLEDNIVFSGWLEDSTAVARGYASARIFVNPSFNEGGPRVLLEALACGLPVLSTPVGIAKDIVIEGKNGIILNWDASQMAVSLLKSLQIYQNHGFDVRARDLSEFEYTSAIRHYADLISELR